jgi:lipopolysaccharide export system permease protein
MSRLYFYQTLDSADRAGMHLREDAVEPDVFHEKDSGYQRLIIDQAMGTVRQLKESGQLSHEEFRQRRRTLARYEIEFHRKFTLSFACFVLFMIGAPLGAIIRKGGFGLPVVVSVLFFVLFHVMSMTGEKFAREGVLEAWQGMWIANVFLLPIAVLLTLKASTDSAVLDMDSYLARLSKIKINNFRIFRKLRKPEKNESRE